MMIELIINSCAMLKKYISAAVTLLAVLVPLVSNPQLVHAESPLVISQVQTGAVGNTNDDFIELFNPNPDPIDLKNYRLVKRTAQATKDTLLKSWTDDTTIPPNSFYLWANSSFTQVTPDVATTGTLADDNGIALRSGADDTGLIIDSVAWGNTNNSFTNVSSVNPAPGMALVRQ